jgi:7-cyano-7-deazaguanine synthase
MRGVAAQLGQLVPPAVNVESIVLLSGGLDSAVLLAQEAERSRVHPVYVRVGLAWEQAELEMLRALLEAPMFASRVEPLSTLEFNMRDVYPATHWALRGTPPAYDTPDEDVYLAGRNLVLLTKAAVVAASRNATRIALGTLANNPFPDATPDFFAAMSRALALGLDHALEVVTPFSALHKEDVIRLGSELGVPLEHTLSCMNPELPAGDGGAESVHHDVPVHCGLCSKCRERRDAFAAAGVTDRTAYANPVPR